MLECSREFTLGGRRANGSIDQGFDGSISSSMGSLVHPYLRRERGVHGLGFVVSIINKEVLGFLSS